LLAAAALAACSSTVAGSAVPVDQSGGGAADASVSPAPVPAGLEEFYSQELDWGSCAKLATSDDLKFYRSASLQCADLTVPLSYDDPTGATVTLKVLRKPATETAQRIGSVITNPGGPGGSGVENAGVIGAYGVAADLNKKFDLVGFDPRGVGSSVPEIRCQTDAERDAAREFVARTRTQAEVDQANAVSKQFALGCATLTGAEQGVNGAEFLANVGTANVAKDLDMLRAVLGDERLTYIGWSYGTAIGTAYAEQFPDNVRAMILDGAIDPNADPVAENVAQTAGFQQAFDDYSQWCSDQESCPLGTDPAKATANFQTLVRPLLDKPLPLADGRVLSFGDAVTGTNEAMYAASQWESLSSALTDLANGNGAALMGIADSYDGRDDKGHYSNLLDAFVAIGCIDGSRTVPADQVDELATKLAEAAPYQATGDPPRGVLDPCAFWPATPAEAGSLTQPSGLPRVLVISTTHDPATPYEAGVKLAETLGAALLTVDGTNHTAYLGGSKCANTIGTTYLTTLDLPADDTTCQ